MARFFCPGRKRQTVKILIFMPQTGATGKLVLKKSVWNGYGEVCVSVPCLSLQDLMQILPRIESFQEDRMQEQSSSNLPMIARVVLVIALALVLGILILFLKNCVALRGTNPHATESPEAGKQIQKERPVRSDPGHPLAALVGKDCKVQFKRNALGGGADLPVSPFFDVINGAQVSCVGRLLAVTRDGLFLKMPEGNRHLWIPMDSILLVDVQE
jgi:hypothetical protein